MDRPECFWCDAPLCPDGLCPNGCGRSELTEFWESHGPEPTATIEDEVSDEVLRVLKVKRRD